MRLLTFEKEGSFAIGVRLGNEVVDICDDRPDLPNDMIALLAMGADTLREVERAAQSAAKRIPLDQIVHGVPIARPIKNIGMGSTFMAHNLEIDPNFKMPQFPPALFFRCSDTMIAHRQPIIRPAISDTLDYEGELAVIIGKGGKHIPLDQALDHVAGYTVHNDGSVREYNFIPMALPAGKNFDGTGAFGPEIVTADELPPGCAGLMLRTHVNSELRQNQDLSGLHWSVAEIVHRLSRLMTLNVGDLIATGTPSGVGVGFKPPRFLKAGDVVEVEIEGIGKLVNPVTDEVMAD